MVNARVYTVEDQNPKAESFAVKQGRFVAVGTTKNIHELSSPGTKLVNAESMTITFGFIDAHTHPASADISELLKVNCDLRTIAAIKQAMSRRAISTGAGQWLMGFKYDDTKLRDRRFLTRTDLDEAVPTHPAQVLHRGDRLRYSPRSAVTPDLADRMKALKGELLAMLTDDDRTTPEIRRQAQAAMVERVNAAYRDDPIDWPRLAAIEQRIWRA